jgi:tryptophan halogenase
VLHQYDEEGFDGHSWLAIHAGMQNWPARSDPTLKLIPEEQSLEWVRERATQLAAAVATVPAHHEYLAKVLGR